MYQNWRAISALVGLLCASCSSRSAVFQSPVQTGVIQNPTCTASINPSPVPVMVDGSGNILGTPPAVSIGVFPSTSVQITAAKAANSGLTIGGTFPTLFNQSFSLSATAVATTSNTITVSIQDTNGRSGSCTATVSFNPTAQTPNLNDLEFNLQADVDGDGKLDLVAWDSSTGYWWVKLGTAASFQNWGAWSDTANWVDVTAVDINKDGKMDIAGQDSNSGAWWTALSTGSSFSTFYAGTWSTSTNWTGIQFGPNSSGAICVFGTDGNGIQWALPLLNTAGQPNTNQAVSPTLTLGANPMTVTYGGSTILTWSATNTTTCALLVNNTQVATGNSGNYTAGPLTATATAVLQCSAPQGTIQSNPATTITVQAPVAPTCGITMNPVNLSGKRQLTFTLTVTGSATTSAITTISNTNLGPTGGQATMNISNSNTGLTASGTVNGQAVGAGGTGNCSLNYSTVLPGPYNLIVQSTSSCVDNYEGSSTSGTYVDEWQCNGGANQELNIATQGSGYAFSFVDSDLCMDTNNGGTQKNTGVVQNNCSTSSASQTWTLSSVSGGYNIVNSNSSTCLDVQNALPTNGTALVINTCSSNKQSQVYSFSYAH